ncbi:hypothetical protein TNCV_629351 [Trichonephila clavipes]|nr:hypothetical protein TNCV_629351 [Trichonephila clavipes]
MRSKTLTVLISVYMTLDAEVHEQIFRSDGESGVKPSDFSPQASLVLFYHPVEGIKGCVNLAQTGDRTLVTRPVPP